MNRKKGIRARVARVQPHKLHLSTSYNRNDIPASANLCNCEWRCMRVHSFTIYLWKIQQKAYYNQDHHKVQTKPCPGTHAPFLTVTSTASPLAFLDSFASSDTKKGNAVGNRATPRVSNGHLWLKLYKAISSQYLPLTFSCTKYEGASTVQAV